MTRAHSPLSAAPGVNPVSDPPGAPLYFFFPMFPIRLSDCFNNAGRGRIESAKYRAFKRFVDPHIKYIQRVGSIEGRVSVAYVVRKPDNRARDLDNLLKSLNDTLTRNAIIHDDSLIHRLTIEWGVPVMGEVTAKVCAL